MPDDRMPPLICFASLVDADETLPPILGQPHLLPGDLEVYIFVSLPTVNRGDDRQIDQRHAEQLHQVQGEWMGL